MIMKNICISINIFLKLKYMKCGWRIHVIEVPGTRHTKVWKKLSLPRDRNRPWYL